MEQVKGLRLPSTYVEVSDNEMEYLDGGSWLRRALSIVAVTAIVVGVVVFTGGVVIAAKAAGVAAKKAKEIRIAACGALIHAGGVTIANAIIA